MERTVTKLSIAGAICYVLWGCLRLDSGYNVYLAGNSVAPSMVQGRVLQDAWNLFFFGVAAIAVALTLNIRNNPWGYWINLVIARLADTGLTFSCTHPGIFGALAGPRRTDPVDSRVCVHHGRVYSEKPGHSYFARITNIMWLRDIVAR